MRRLYSLVLMLVAPLVVARLWWRGRVAPGYRQRWGERFGYVPRIENNPIWVHAVSVGETQAAAPLIEALLERYPQYPLLVTTTTPTGSERVRALFGDRVRHCYMPYDLPGAVARFLNRTRPRLVLIMETEIWPNLFYQCQRRGVPLIVANARLSQRSAEGYGRFRSLAGETLQRIDVIAAQDERDARRFEALGARPAAVEVIGSIKFDIEVGDEVRGQGGELRRAFFAGRPVWLAASTHEGEDEQVLDAFAQIKQAIPDLLLVLVPRHPERFDRVAALCRARGYSVVRRSEGVAVSPATDIFVGDSMGELLRFCAAADVVFMGGSLVPVGGHNILEPAALGRPVVYGPQMFNFAAIEAMFRDQEAARQVANADELAAVVSEWLREPALAEQYGRRGLAIVEANRGALGRLLRIVARTLPPARGE